MLRKWQCCRLRIAWQICLLLHKRPLVPSALIIGLVRSNRVHACQLACVPANEVYAAVAGANRGASPPERRSTSTLAYGSNICVSAAERTAIRFITIIVCSYRIRTHHMLCIIFWLDRMPSALSGMLGIRLFSFRVFASGSGNILYSPTAHNIITCCIPLALGIDSMIFVRNSISIGEQMLINDKIWDGPINAASNVCYDAANYHMESHRKNIFQIFCGRAFGKPIFAVEFHVAKSLTFCSWLSVMCSAVICSYAIFRNHSFLVETTIGRCLHSIIRRLKVKAFAKLWRADFRVRGTFGELLIVESWRHLAFWISTDAKKTWIGTTRNEFGAAYESYSKFSWQCRLGGEFYNALSKVSRQTLLSHETRSKSYLCDFFVLVHGGKRTSSAAIRRDRTEKNISQY